MTKNKDGQAPSPAINWHRNFEKSSESLLGICQGLVADNVLNTAEILFLEAWLKDNEEITECWPGDVIASRVASILADGTITAEELEDLKNTLIALLGGSFQDTGAAGGFATRLPVDTVETIHFQDAVFCLTGKFLYGPRRRCEDAITSRGGRIIDNITRDLDYLVIGTLSSRDWAQSSHGRKIEKAVEQKRQGQTLLILAEERWSQFL
jgi:NAD-dependent DNA ligase